MTPEMLEQMKKQWEAMGLDPKQMMVYMNNALEMQNSMQEQMSKAFEDNPVMKSLMELQDDKVSEGDVLNFFDDSPEVNPDSDLNLQEQKAVLCAANLSYNYNHYLNTLETLMPAEDLLEGLENSWDITDRKSLIETVDWLAVSGHRVYFKLIWNELKTKPKPEWRKAISDLEVQNLTVEDLDSERFHPYAANILEIYPLLLTKGFFSTMKDPNVKAWDLQRAINLCRYGFDLEFFSREEALERILSYAQNMFKTYDSWRSLSEGFLVGCGMWSGSPELLSDRLEHHETLLTHEKSLWKTMAW